tara:strand:+ start:3509 stop:3775 length:267 start_codon:yes stop_codon:yes gene_type:complete
MSDEHNVVRSWLSPRSSELLKGLNAFSNGWSEQYFSQQQSSQPRAVHVGGSMSQGYGPRKPDLQFTSEVLRITPASFFQVPVDQPVNP